jgi:hypothetical protein
MRAVAGVLEKVSMFRPSPSQSIAEHLPSCKGLHMVIEVKSVSRQSYLCPFAQSNAHSLSPSPAHAKVGAVVHGTRCHKSLAARADSRRSQSKRAKLRSWQARSAATSPLSPPAECVSEVLPDFASKDVSKEVPASASLSDLRQPGAHLEQVNPKPLHHCR